MRPPRSLLALLVMAAVALGAPDTPAGAGHPFSVTGRFLYEDKAWDYGGWTGERPELPVRGADVTVLDAASGKVLGRGVTVADGTFAVECASKLSAVDLQVRVDTRNRHHDPAGPFTPVGVLDPAGAPYAAFSPVFPTHDTSADLDVGTSTVLAVWLPEGDGNPFNCFDLAVSAWQLLTGPDVGAPHRQRGIRLHWPSVTGSWALGRDAWIASDDGYDDAVILHETGHVVHNLYSDSDSPGGSHHFGDSDQDPRLAFSEGYATFFGASVMDFLGQQALYLDCEGETLVAGVQLRLMLETAVPYSNSTAGACDEVAVACTLFDLVDDEQSSDDSAGWDDDGFIADTLVNGAGAQRAWWQVFSGPVRKAPRVTIDDAWDGWWALHGAEGQTEALRTLFDQRALRFWNDASEPDNTRAQASAIEALSSAHWSPEHTLYYSDDPQADDGTGDRDWYAVELTAGQVVRIETRYPDGAFDARTQVDPFLVLYDPDEKRVASDESSGTGRNACIDAFSVPVTGTFTFVVRSRNALHRYGRYDLRVVLLSD